MEGGCDLNYRANLITKRGKVCTLADGEAMKTILRREIALAEIRVNTYTLPRFKVGDIDIYISSAL